MAEASYLTGFLGIAHLEKSPQFPFYIDIKAGNATVMAHCIYGFCCHSKIFNGRLTRHVHPFSSHKQDITHKQAITPTLNLPLQEAKSTHM